MPKIAVVIEYDQPDDKYWLNPDSVSLALQSYCKNIKLNVLWAEGGNPWAKEESVNASTNRQSTAIAQIADEMHEFVVKNISTPTIYSIAHIERWSQQLRTLPVVGSK